MGKRIRCRFPEKDQLTKTEAKDRALALSRKPGAQRVDAYSCASHWHVGHRKPPPRRRRQW